MKNFVVFILLTCWLCPALWAQPILTFEEYASGFTFPVDIVHADDDRLFIVERNGVISIIEANGTVLSTPFLDIQERVENFNSASGEIGLLGLAFHPDYVNNGYFYVNYINTDFNTTVSRFQVSSNNPNIAEADSETIIMDISQPFLNHNGGCLKFGPDDYLYIGMGDGGSAGDPMAFSQNRMSPLGKMLRIDVDNGTPYSIPADNPFVNDNSTLDEIWAIGLRNPWRFSFDRQTGDMWIGDVGQSLFEEINFEAAESTGGLNYGWRCLEGNEVFNDNNCDDPSTFTPPVEAYPHTGHCSVTGGYVYRGTAHPNIQGYYLYADYCSGQFWSMIENGAGDFEVNEAGNFQSFAVSALGEDQDGELYLAHLTQGRIYKIGFDVCSDFSLSLEATDESCEGAADGAIDLSLNNGMAPFNILWSTGETMEDLEALETGTYSVTVSDSQGCERIEEVVITNSSAGTFSISASGPLEFCDGGEVELTASAIPPEYSYQWYNGTELLEGETAANLLVTASGDYYVRLVGPCEVANSSNWIFVEVEPVPSAFINPIGGTTAACLGDTLYLNAGPAPEGYTYQWFREIELLEGETESTLAVTVEGSYYVTLDGNCETDQSNWLFVDFVGPDLLLEMEPTVCSDTDFDLTMLQLIDLNNAMGIVSYHSGTPADESNVLNNLVVNVEEPTTYYVLSTAGNCSDELPVGIDVFPAVDMPMISLDTAIGRLSIPDLYTTYQWYDADGPIAGETMSFYFPSTFGVYSVLVTDANGCTVFSDVFDNDLVSNNELETAINIKVFPNPFNEQVNLKIESLAQKTLTIRVVDVVGQNIWQAQHRVNGQFDLDINLKQLSSGLYFLMIENEEGRLVRKLVKD